MENFRANDDQIIALISEASRAGDLEMVATCERAIRGDKRARRECSDVIAAAVAIAAARAVDIDA